MSELTLFFKAIKTALGRPQQQDPSVVINRDGSVRINLETPEGRERVLQAARSVQHIQLPGTQKSH